MAKSRAQFSAETIGDLTKRVIFFNERATLRKTKLADLKKVYEANWRGEAPMMKAMSAVDRRLEAMAKADPGFEDAEHPRDNRGRFVAMRGQADQFRDVARPSDDRRLRDQNAGYASSQTQVINETRFTDLYPYAGLAGGYVLTDPAHEAKAAQGVTLEVLGQDGLSYAPADDRTLDTLRTLIAGWNGDGSGVSFDWRTVGGYLDRLDRGVAVNAAYLVPQGTVRMMAVGWEDRAASPDELRQMKQTPVPDAELRRAKDHLKGSLMLSLENTASRMSHLARQEIYFDRQFGLDETLQGIERVTAADVQRVAADLFRNGSMSATVLGNVNGLQVPRERLDLD